MRGPAESGSAEFGRAMRPFGSWPSPITAALISQAAIRVDEVRGVGDALYWSESRPAEGGRVAIMSWRDGVAREVTPPDANVRTRVHEYGGGAWMVSGSSLVYSDLATARLMRLDTASGEAIALTAESTDRFADGVIAGPWFVCVRERAAQPEPVNEVVAVALDGLGDVRILVDGADFYAAPRVHGSRLAWLQWNHPNMPWDGTELWVGEWRGDAVGAHVLVAGGADVSIVQPEWAFDGSLYFCSDQSGWWNLYRSSGSSIAAVVTGDFDISVPAWGLAQSRYALLADGSVAYVHGDPLAESLVVRDQPVAAAEPLTSIASLAASGDGVIFAGGSYESEVRVWKAQDGRATPIAGGRSLELDKRFFPPPQVISFGTAHALYYAPAHPDYIGLVTERPPLVVMAHGGPTGAARTQLHLLTRFFTSRGFAVVDVNYRGSTGYGRQFRALLDGAWGVADVEDCIGAVEHLTERGLVDPARVIIRGSSAGGLTVLAALLAAPDRFAAATVLYGIADLELLARDTHKFESRYLDRLIGPYPAARAVYVERSPLHRAAEIRTPLLVMQGSDDKVVPPEQARTLVATLAASGVRHRYLEFEGEGHGFRRADSQIRALEAEADFYAEILGYRVEPGQ